jgi:hypothetical protein
MARQAEKAGLPGELPVMAGLVESGLENKQGYYDVNGMAYGFFSIHPGNYGMSATQARDPVAQLRWFIQQALEHKAEFAGKGPGAYGAWCQAVEVSAYPDRYQGQLAAARGLVGGPGAEPAPSGARSGGAGQDQPEARPPDSAPQGGASPELLPNGLVYPLAGRHKIIGVPYVGTHTDYGNWESDRAIDISTPKGTPVYAVEDGTIGSQIGPLSSSDPRLLGLRLHLVTGDDEYYYAHLSRLVVRAGEHVVKGQLLGYSGVANGVEHLHFASKRANPLSLFGS